MHVCTCVECTPESNDTPKKHQASQTFSPLFDLLFLNESS